MVLSPVSLICCLGVVASKITYRPGPGMVSVMVLLVSSTLTLFDSSVLPVTPGLSAYLRISISFWVLASQFIGSPSFSSPSYNGWPVLVGRSFTA